jgi:tRNA(Arg) A34 adenosine deaminase TadA
MPEKEFYLEMAIEEAFLAIRSREGGPFGAVIVRDGVILGKGHNTVLKTHDPTAHAEINAIRSACDHVGEHHLTGATLFSNFEPCPMCLAATYWADIREVWYSAGRELAAKIGFRDDHLYSEFSLRADEREVVTTRLPLRSMDKLMETWNGMEGKVYY